MWVWVYRFVHLLAMFSGVVLMYSLIVGCRDGNVCFGRWLARETKLQTKLQTSIPGAAPLKNPYLGRWEGWQVDRRL